MIYAVIDTNVIVSALLSHTHNSSTVKIMEAIFNGMICPLYNSEIINEYADVLTRPKFRIPSHIVGEIINLIEKLGIESDRVHTDEIIKDLDDVVSY
jgi:putative PIN family toxin of toxin-antitoxin system